MNRPKVCVFLLVLLALCLTWRVEGQTGNPSARFPESRSYSPGKAWLEWNSSERTGFVRGFIVGHEEGYRQACTASQADNHVTTSTTGFDPVLRSDICSKRIWLTIRSSSQTSTINTLRIVTCHFGLCSCRRMSGRQVRYMRGFRRKNRRKIRAKPNS